MSLWDKLWGEFVDVIEWTDDSDDTLVYRFERYGNEIKYGAMLTVREGQKAIFVNEGRVADVFDPGMYKLETNNLPLFSTLEGWSHGFESPFKAEIYFVNTTRFVDLKWGTKNPIMLRDREFGMVRLRAFGTYAMRVETPEVFLKEIVGTDSHFTTDEITQQLRNMLVAGFSSALGKSKVPVLDLAANYDQLSEFILSKVSPDIAQYGLKLTRFLVENISLPPEVEAALDKRTSMGIVGNLNDYVTFQSGVSMEKAAENPSGGASDGVGMGMGFAMANQLSQRLGQSPSTIADNIPPDLPMTTYFVADNNAKAGPFSLEQLALRVSENQLTHSTLIWTQGMGNWKKASEVESVAGLLSHQPPPLPS